MLGSATQNNQAVQERVLASNVLEIYFVRLQIENDELALRRGISPLSPIVVYALGSLIRGYDAGIRSFLKGQALIQLLSIYQAHKNKSLDVKILTLVLDILNPEMSRLKDDEFLAEDLGRWCAPLSEQCGIKDREVANMYHLASKRLRCIKVRC